MKIAIALVAALAVIIGVGPLFHTVYAVGWFFLNESTIPPQDKADLLSGILNDPSLLEVPSLKAYAYSSAAVLASLTFSFMARSSSMLAGAGYAVLSGACVAYYGGLGVLGVSCGASIFLLALGLHILIRRSEDQAGAESPNNKLQPTTDAAAE